MTEADALLGALVRNRQFKTKLGRFTFLWRRPTTVELISLQSAPQVDCVMVQSAVYGWEGVTKHDIANNGEQDPAPFSEIVWRAWCADRADFWEPIAAEILKAYNAYSESLEDRAKKD